MLIRTNSFPGTKPLAIAPAKPPRERTKGEQLLVEIESFMRRNPHWSQHRFGREALNNPNIVRKLQEGLDPEPITERRVRKFIAENGG